MVPDVGRTGAEASPLVVVEAAVVVVVELVDEVVLLVEELDVEVVCEVIV